MAFPSRRDSADNGPMTGNLLAMGHDTASVRHFNLPRDEGSSGVGRAELVLVLVVVLGR